MKGGKGKPRTFAGALKRVLFAEKIYDGVVDVKFDHEALKPARVSGVLEEFGLVTQLAHGLFRLDLTKPDQIDLTVAYVNDFTISDAKELGLYWDRKKN